MMVSTFLLVSTAMTAEPAKQAELLQTFRAEFISITPGQGIYPRSFTMGSDRQPNEKPAHQVTFEYDFMIAKYEVPQNLWEAIMGQNPSRWKGKRNSVEMLSYDDAVRFCEKVTQLMSKRNLITATEVVRLPSEAEWEYAARAGTKSAYSFGPVAHIDEYAWHTGNAAGNDPAVGEKKPNPWGLCDVHGYLWEWCLDTGHNNYQSAPTNGTAWLDREEELRILRGGSWKNKVEQLTSSCREIVRKHVRDDAVGLRCVLVEER